MRQLNLPLGSNGLIRVNNADLDLEDTKDDGGTCALYLLSSIFSIFMNSSCNALDVTVN